MTRLSLVWCAALALCSCSAERNDRAGRDEALSAIEQTCLRTGAPDLADVQGSADKSAIETCDCVRDWIENQFRDDELNAIATLGRIKAEMATVRAEDFQTLERLRRQHNATLDQLTDQSRSRAVAMASREALAACSEQVPDSGPVQD